MNHYQQLPASGDVEPATLDFVDLPEPLELDAGVECLGGYAICPALNEKPRCATTLLLTGGNSEHPARVAADVADGKVAVASCALGRWISAVPVPSPKLRPSG